MARTHTQQRLNKGCGFEDVRAAVRRATLSEATYDDFDDDRRRRAAVRERDPGPRTRITALHLSALFVMCAV